MCLRKKLFSFRKSKHQKEPTPHESIEHLRESEENLRGTAEVLKKEIEKQLNIAKREKESNKKDALAALKRKRSCEKQLRNIEITLGIIRNRGTSPKMKEDQDIDPSTEVLQAMGSAATATKTLNKKMNVGRVPDLMKYVTEQQRKAHEVSDAISHTVGFEDNIDDVVEVDLLAELEKLEQEDLNKPPPVVTETPYVVKAEVTSPKVKEDQDIDPSTEVLQDTDSAATALKSLNKKMDVGKVQNLTEDVAEQTRKTQEFYSAKSHLVDYGDDMVYMDEDEMSAEQEKLQQEDLNKKLVKAEEPAAEPPSVLTEKPSVVKAEAKPAYDDEDLTKREAWAS